MATVINHYVASWWRKDGGGFGCEGGGQGRQAMSSEGGCGVIVHWHGRRKEIGVVLGANLMVTIIKFALNNFFIFNVLHHLVGNFTCGISCK